MSEGAGFRPVAINVAVGLVVVAATLLASDLETNALWFSVLSGLLLAGCAGYAAWAWERISRGRRIGLSALSALVALVLLAEWWSADFPVSLRRIMIALGAVGALAGAYAAWRARA
jgi:hypothetical protein